MSEKQNTTKGYPLFEIIGRYPLPVFVKSTKTIISSGCDGSANRIDGQEIYRIQRILRVPKVVLQLLPTLKPTTTTTQIHPTTAGYGRGDVAAGNKLTVFSDSKPGLQLSVPKDYSGLFQVLN